MQLKINNIDIRKADLGLEHVYTPQTTYNLSLDKKERIGIVCDYFQVGERLKYTSVKTEDKSFMFDFRKIFQSKVKSIRNFTVEDAKGGKLAISKPEDFLALPEMNEINAILMDVAVHLINSDTLTEDEEKN